MTAISGEVVAAALSRYRALLATHRERLDEMNVFPVPDGDTGSNLLSTVGEIDSALDLASSDGDLDALASRLGTAAIRAARGNSGIILAEALRGFTGALARMRHGEGVAAALAQASRLARGAVSDPVEGTVLTVAEDAARAATERAVAGGSELDVARAAADEAWLSLARTPTLLPALREAGVVDAGGAGYALWLDALVAALGGELPDRVPPPPRSPAPVDAAVGSQRHQQDVAGPRYELVVDLDAEPAAVEELRRRWARAGDSMVVVGDSRQWRAHLHTDDPEAARALAEDLGTVRDVEITDMHGQVAARRSSRRQAATVTTAVVAVAATEELAHLFEVLGASVIVAGGRGARPSGAAIIDAIDRTGADEVVVLPDDGPTIDVARRAAIEARRPAVVAPAASMVEGLVAMRSFDARGRAGEVAERMGEAISRVYWAEVLPVVRPSSVDGHHVVPGDWLVRGHRPRFSLAVGDALDAAILALDELVEAIDGGTGDLLEGVTVLRGSLGDRRGVEMLRDHVESLFPSVVVEAHDTAERNVAYSLAARRRP